MTKVFTEAERADLSALVEGSVISAEWIQGVKKGWAEVSKDLKRYKGRPKLTDHPKQKNVIKAMDGAVQSLKLLHNYVNRLSDDLLINKGAWTLPSKLGAKEASRTKRWKTKIVEELHIAKKAVLKYLGLALDKQKHLRSKNQLSDEKLATLLQRTHAYVDKGVDQVGAALKRLFMALNKTQKYYAQSGRKLGGKGFEPKVNRVGPFTVVFKDTPDMSPKKLGHESYKKGKHGARTTVRDLSPGHLMMVTKEKGIPQWRHPKERAAYLKTFKKALARLEAKDLAWLANIKSSVHPPTKHLGAAALYYRDTDSMAVLSKPSTELVRAIIHELGHRYWYKRMNAEDRHNFGKWFGKVKAVTKYGGTNEVEDFAEVFSYYVMDRKLTKDQHDRFQQFMKGERPKTEAIEEGMATKAQKCQFCDNPAQVSLIWAGGQAYTPCCNAHEQEARNHIREQDDSVVDVKRVESGPITYREHTFTPHARMDQALRTALDFVDDEDTGKHFGLQADSQRAQSAVQEAPAQPPPRARIGRRSIPRGATIKTHSGPDIQGVKTGGPIRRSTVGRRGKGTSGLARKQELPSREVQEIPDSLLQMLATDWKSMRAHRVHDNRMTVNIDGVRYSVYTRRG